MKRGLLLLALIGSTAAAVQDIRWNEAGVHAQSLELAPGKFAEVCGPLKAGQSVAWSFEADGALNFNIHYHEGEKVTYPARENGISQRKGELKVELDQGYCWMWSNKGAQPVKLKLELQRR
ncbi:hypothetical protein [Pelomonas sp. SE-A7]|uniref:hypothetical protein n=1 Tax=Pelomonas sp. SE-A7 TaxID=3054953 RepID=UPI00259D0BD5|nr:hypothetical protein [Pelomonas sp. SE-A7]MDM4765408.1 hypothetical protein [Pelomonas sp. SE-A7]